MTGGPVTLTPHPLQRVGAFALARLADVRHPKDIGETGLAQAVLEMHDDLKDTTHLPDAKAPGGFWLRASYLFWPNSRVPNTTNRKKLTVSERRDQLREWRTLPGPDETIGVPCALCGRPACGFYGKVDVALAASVNYRNTTPRGHQGLALCRGCLASFHALPYGCAIARGRAAVLHSWDEDFLGKTVAEQVDRMRQDASVGAGRFGDSRPYARQAAALDVIRGYDRELADGVDLMVFSNSNKEQVLDVHPLAQPAAEWVRRVRYQPSLAAGWRYLLRAHHSPKIPGLFVLAHNLFDRPRNVIPRAAAYLAEHSGQYRVPPGEAPDLAVLCRDYAMKVLTMETSDADEIRVLAARAAKEASQDGSEFMRFVHAARRPGDLRNWLRGKAISQVRYSRVPEAFITERQWRLLFDSDDAFLHRDLLMVCVLEEVHRLAPQWRADDPDKRRELDEETGDEEEDEDQ